MKWVVLGFCISFLCCAAYVAKLEKSHKTEKQLRKYFEENINNLDPIEGIWTVSSYEEVDGSDYDNVNYATAAIIKDSSRLGRDYIEVIIDGEGWTPHTITAEFTKTTYDNFYISKQYSKNGSVSNYNFTFEKDGVFRSNKKAVMRSGRVIGTSQIYYTKLYPKPSNIIMSNDVEPTTSSEIPYIAVLELYGKGVSQIEASALTDRLRNELIYTKKFRIIEREVMDIILSEQKFQLSGCTSTECIVEVGQILGVERIVAGSVSKVGDVYSISARIVEVETGEILLPATYDHEGNIGDLMKFGMREVASILSGRLLIKNR